MLPLLNPPPTSAPIALLSSVAIGGFKILNQASPVPDLPIPTLALIIKATSALPGPCHFSDVIFFLSTSYSLLPPALPLSKTGQTPSDLRTFACVLPSTWVPFPSVPHSSLLPCLGLWVTSPKRLPQPPWLCPFQLLSVSLPYYIPHGT